jgi:hypothetical protein
VIGNRIITHGMGKSRGIPGRAGMITQGYGGLFKKIVEAGVRLYKAGQSGAKRAAKELEDIIVWAKLIRVNDNIPETTIKGFTRVNVSQAKNIAVNLMEGMRVRTRKTWDGIKITIKRLR